MVGKYVQIRDSYISLNEALRHAGLKSRTRVQVHYVESTDLESAGTACLAGMDAILVPGGFGERGIEGKIAAVRYAREQGVPYLGICLGMQVAVIEYARSVLGLPGANSTEFERDATDPVIALITEWRDRTGETLKRDDRSELGGTMRLGAQESRILTGTLARKVYGRDAIHERHRHRYEFNNNYLEAMQKAGLRRSRRSRRTAWSRSSSCRRIRGSSACSSTRSSRRTRATGIRCSRASCARRASTRPGKLPRAASA